MESDGGGGCGGHNNETHKLFKIVFRCKSANQYEKRVTQNAMVTLSYSVNKNKKFFFFLSHSIVINPMSKAKRSNIFTLFIEWTVNTQYWFNLLDILFSATLICSIDEKVFHTKEMKFIFCKEDKIPGCDKSETFYDWKRPIDQFRKQMVRKLLKKTFSNFVKEWLEIFVWKICRKCVAFPAWLVKFTRESISHHIILSFICIWKQMNTLNSVKVWIWCEYKIYNIHMS